MRAQAPAASSFGGNTGILVLITAVATLYLARDVLIPFAFALVLTFLLTPAVTVLQKLRIGRLASVALTVLMAIAVFAVIGWSIANQLVGVANDLPLYRENIQAKIQAIHLPTTGQLGHAASSIKELISELSGSGVQPSPQAHNQRQRGIQPAPSIQIAVPESTSWRDLRDWGMSILAPVGRAGIVAIFTVFMLLKREDLRNRLLRLAGHGQLNVMTQALDDAAGRVSRYIMMQFLVNAGFGIVFGAGLFWIGVPYAALWGALAAMLRIVPYVGTLVAATLPLALSLAVFDGWLKPLTVFLLVVGLELIVANVLEPWLYGTHVGISSLALLVTAVFWTVLWGPAGLILSTPLSVCVVVLGRYVPQLSFLHVLLGDEPVLSSQAQVYQRLLAMDQVEAQTVVNQVLKEKSLLELYDSVLIPALTLAEQDRHKGAIDSVREEFLFLSINEMIVEFSERDLQASAEEERSAAETPARIFCLPAHDRADEVTAAMLAQILEKNGLASVAFSIGGPAANEWLALVNPGPKDVVCISALPPYAFAPARLLCKQIRERFPKLMIVVGVWGFSGDLEKAKARFERTQPDRLSSSIAQAMDHIRELIHPHPERNPSEDDPGPHFAFNVSQAAASDSTGSRELGASKSIGAE
jgi:predicted PurR-regulated permease PerM